MPIFSLKGENMNSMAAKEMLFKDAVLDRLSDSANVAQFVSFDAHVEQRYARIRGFAPNHKFPTAERAIAALLTASADASVNVRSFTPDNPKSREFIYGLRNLADAASAVSRLASTGLITIVNETVDVHDGGASGVALGN